MYTDLLLISANVSEAKSMAKVEQKLLNNLITSVLVLNKDLVVLYANSATEQLLGISNRRLYQQNFTALFQYSSLDLSLLEKPFSRSQSLSASDVTLILDAKPMQVELSATPLLWQQEDCLLLELKSVNKAREINQDLYQQEQQQAAKKLIRNLAHEIKNPLAGLRGAAELLEQELTQDLQEYTSMIIEQADRLTKLVDRLLGPQKLGEKKPHNIHSILEKVRQLTEIAQPDIEFIRDYDPSLPELNIDAAQIEQAILNVVNNAVEALKAQANGKIKLRTRTKLQAMIHGKKHRLAAEIHIIDNGPGINSQLKETLFYPTITGRADGSGLGLAICRELINQHQGKISAKSGTGKTTFSILLPIN